MYNIMHTTLSNADILSPWSFLPLPLKLQAFLASTADLKDVLLTAQCGDTEAGA